MHPLFDIRPDVVKLDRGNNTTCLINLHGATIVSWRIRTKEQLYVSKIANMDQRLPIQGGIKFGFPQTAPWSFGPDMGFAHVTKWNLEKQPELLPNGDVEVVFCLTDTPFTRSMWNYKFRIIYRIMLCEKTLKLHICVTNQSVNLPFTFKLLLKNFLKVPDVRDCELTGFCECRYIDDTRLGHIYTEKRDKVRIGEWTDREYEHTVSEHIISNVAPERSMRLQKYNLPDTILWNPWQDKVEEIKDMFHNDFTYFLCIQTGNTYCPIILPPGKGYEASQILHQFKCPKTLNQALKRRKKFLVESGVKCDYLEQQYM